MRPKSPQYRADVDGLRALAIGLVLFYHADPSVAPAGFLGVDVFFVISGYLIGGVLLSEIGQGRFSLAHFYARRIRRILPALAFVVTCVVVVGLAVLSAKEALDLSTSATSALLGISNLKFWMRSDYFAPGSEARPLLMTWSLGVEEQFYLVFPAILLALRRLRRWPISWALATLAALSLALWLALSRFDPQSAFYLLPPRAWELLAGAVLAARGLEGRQPSLTPLARETLALLSLAVLLAVTYLCSGERTFGGLAAVAAVLAACGLIAADGAVLNRRVLAHPLMVGAGLISYSWYLWHWPLMAFARLATGAEPPRHSMLAIIALSGMLAYLTWRLVERPFRSARVSDRRAIGLGLAGLAVALILPGALKLSGGWPQRLPPAARAVEIAVAMGRGDCLAPFGVDRPDLSPQCAPQGPEPAIALIGDSHASALGPGLQAVASADGRRLLQMTKSSCWPLVGLSKVDAAAPQDADACQRFVAAAVDKIAEDPTVGAVVISGAWPRFDETNPYRIVGRPGTAQMHDLDALELGLPPVIARLTRSGKRVILTGDPPAFEFDPARQALADALPVRRTLAALVGPALPTKPGLASGAAVLPRNRAVRALLIKLAAADPQVVYLPLREQFCTGALCRYADADGLLFVDEHHLSVAGSRAINWTLAASDLTAWAPSP